MRHIVLLVIKENDLLTYKKKKPGASTVGNPPQFVFAFAVLACWFSWRVRLSRHFVFVFVVLAYWFSWRVRLSAVFAVLVYFFVVVCVCV